MASASRRSGRRRRPTSSPSVTRSGKLTVDLTAPDLDLDEQTVEASVGIGELLVLVPEDTDITVDAHVGVGNADVLGEEENGFDVDFASISGTSGTQELTLDLEAGIGDIRVERG